MFKSFTLTYNNYYADINFNESKKIFVGKVRDIKENIIFETSKFENLLTEFKNSIKNLK